MAQSHIHSLYILQMFLFSCLFVHCHEENVVPILVPKSLLPLLSLLMQLDDKPIQHREVMGHESVMFKSYFKNIELLEGG